MLPANNYRISKYSLLRGYIKSIAVIFLGMTLCGLAACGGDKDTSSTQAPAEEAEAVVEEASSNDIADEVKANKEKWLSHAVTDYQIEMQKLCFCAPDAVRLMIFEVSHDEITSVRYADTGEDVDPSLYNQYNTIEGLFALVEQALAKDPEYLSIAYNDDYGYIKELTIDYQENIADDEITIIASNMKPSQ